MPAFLIKATHPVSLPVEGRPSPAEIADWCERTLGSETVRITRVGDTFLEFRSKFRWLSRPRNDSLALVSEGEIEIRETPDGALLIVRANPHIWESLVPIVGVIWYAGWTNGTAVLKWAGGLGGLLLGGLLVALTWSSLHSVLASIGTNLRKLLPRGTAQP